MNVYKKISLPVVVAVELGLALLIFPFVTMYAQAPAAGGQAPAATTGGEARGGRGAGGRGGANQGGGGRGARGGVGTNPAPTSPVTGNAVAGKKLYFDYTCYGCHGFNGETGRAFVGNWGNLQTEAGFIAFLRLRGDRASMTPATSMPNYPVDTLSDKQAKDIYAYIRTFKSNSPEVKDIPTLNAIVNAASRPYKP
jgi:mono/diheme cytochrome c family protein